MFQAILREFERRQETKINAVHSENGGEYTPVANFATGRGIAVHRSAPYASQANGLAERANRTIFEMARTTLVQSGWPNTFWAEAVINAAAIYNRLPQAGGIIPFEKLYDRKLSVNKFRPFGCLAYVFQHESKRKRLDSKIIPCILLATLEHGKYRVYDLATKKVYVSRHVVFSETEFPARILTKKSRANCTESRSDYSDSGIYLGMGTHSSSDDESEANSEFKGEGEASADGEQDQDEEEDQDDEED
jgi:transposase InsO family protein